KSLLILQLFDEVAAHDRVVPVTEAGQATGDVRPRSDCIRAGVGPVRREFGKEVERADVDSQTDRISRDWRHIGLRTRANVPMDIGCKLHDFLRGISTRNSEHESVAGAVEA